MTDARPDIDELWGQLQGRIGAVASPWLRQLLESVVMGNAERLRKWPAALTVHHAYAGGLLEHILKVAEVGQSVAAAYGRTRTWCSPAPSCTTSASSKSCSTMKSRPTPATVT